MRIDAETSDKKIMINFRMVGGERSWFQATPLGLTLWLTPEEADSLVFKGGSAVQELEMLGVKK